MTETEEFRGISPSIILHNREHIWRKRQRLQYHFRIQKKWDKRYGVIHCGIGESIITGVEGGNIGRGARASFYFTQK